MFYAAYAGPSMNPTLREPEVIEVMPYAGRPFRVGDVALFLAPGTDRPVVHRIARVTPAGISTFGDNNTQADALLLQPKSIQGRVVAAWRGQKRRKIAGGLHGRLTRRWAGARRVLDRAVSPLLHPFYQALSHWGGIARALPTPLRPRVVVFHAGGRDRLRLLLGRRVIGRHDGQGQWQIDRPFELLVERRSLAGPQDNNRSACLPASHLWTQGVRHALVLADGSCWGIASGDEEAASIVAQLGCAMQLGPSTDEIGPVDEGNLCRLLVQVDAHSSVADRYVPAASGGHGVVACVLRPCGYWGGPYANLVRLSLLFAREAQARGGVLIHGALAERDGIAVILAAPGGTGKTTASKRLPPPWRSRCDDTTLVVRDPQGTYWAHPWPTWSRFLDGGPGGAWDVQAAVPLKGIFFLIQAVQDRVERVGMGQAVGLLGEAVGQASGLMAPGLCKEELRALHLERFHNLCALGRAVPVHLLHISLAGTFWEAIEQVLQGGHSHGT